MKIRNVALIVLYDDEKKILLQHRADDAERLPGYWAFFGGGIEEKETPEIAVKRETFEELNYTLKGPRFVIVKKSPDKVRYVFTEKCIDKNILKLQEGQGMGWYAIPETKKLRMSNCDREILAYLNGKL